MIFVETLIQLDLDVVKPSENIRALRAAVGYIEKNVHSGTIAKEVYISVYGYGGGGMQESCSYKIQFTSDNEYVIYKGFISPDEWDLKFFNNQEDEICISLTEDERIIFNAINKELSNYIIDEAQVTGDDTDCNMLPRTEYIATGDDFYSSENFNTTYLKLLKNVYWPFLTYW